MGASLPDECGGLSVVLLVFVQSDLFAHESGLLSVVVMGMFLGNSNLPNFKSCFTWGVA